MNSGVVNWIGASVLMIAGAVVTFTCGCNLPPQHDYHIYNVRPEPNMLEQVAADGFNVSDDGKYYVFWDDTQSNVVAQFAATPMTTVIRVH